MIHRVDDSLQSLNKAFDTLRIKTLYTDVLYPNITQEQIVMAYKERINLCINGEINNLLCRGGL